MSYDLAPGIPIGFDIGGEADFRPPTALAASLAAIDSTMTPSTEYRWQLIAAKCRALMAGYDARWSYGPYLPVAVEQVVTSELYNPETNRRSRTFTVAGKLDLTARRGERVVLIDHKTTSDDISDPNSPYWRQLVVESQPSHYMLLEWLNGRKVDEAVWDVVRKPGISPKKLSKAELQSAAITKTYQGVRIYQASVDALSKDPDGRETLEMYEVRLVNDCTKERPEWYFQRRAVPRLDAEVREHAGELWDHGQDILQARNTERHPRNSGACLLYGSPCAFLGICSGHDTPDSNNWKKKTWMHAELPVLDGDGREVLTNSRIRSFQTCRRKHYFEYELGIERLDEEERETLFFGNLWHEAQAAYWKFLINQGEQHHVSSSDAAPATEVGITATTNETPFTF